MNTFPSSVTLLKSGGGWSRQVTLKVLPIAEPLAVGGGAWGGMITHLSLYKDRVTFGFGQDPQSPSFYFSGGGGIPPVSVAYDGAAKRLTLTVDGRFSGPAPEVPQSPYYTAATVAALSGGKTKLTLRATGALGGYTGSIDMHHTAASGAPEPQMTVWLGPSPATKGP